MSVNHLTVGLNMPAGLKSQGSGTDESVQGLPPFRQRRAFLVDEYPACPPDWMRSTGRVKSYFVPIVDGAGMWLDFRDCLRTVPQDVAIVVSVQGINAITGMRVENPSLEQYLDNCPVHKQAFGPDRFCQRCNTTWPKQNYLSSAATPEGMLWLDGFRASAGAAIRQFLFTSETARGVANAIIGKDRVFALGVSFFLSRTHRPKRETIVRAMGTFNALPTPTDWKLMDGPSPYVDASWKPTTTWDSQVIGNSFSCQTGDDGGLSEKTFCCSTNMQRSYDPRDRKHFESRKARSHVTSNATDVLRSVTSHVNVAKLEIAAGARVDQRIYDDPNPLSFYQDEPSGLIVVNYCSEADAARIIDAGKADVSGSLEGFLQNVPVGN